MSPPLAVDLVEHYFGRVKGFPAMTELIDIMKNYVPVKTAVTNLDASRAIRYGNDSPVYEHIDLVWEKLYEEVRRNRVLVFNRVSCRA